MAKDDFYLKKELYDLIKIDSEFFEFIHNNSLDGLWYWDLENPEKEWMSEKFWTVLGYDPKTKKHEVSEWQDIIHPKDLEKAVENFHKHCENKDHPYDQVVRYRHKDGSTVWVRCRGVVIRDENGTPIRMLGAHNNLTDYMMTRQRLKDEESKFRLLLEESDDLITQVDLNGTFLYVNSSSTKYLGVPPEQCIGLSAFDFIHPEDQEVTQNAFSEWLESDQKVFTFENRQIHRSGSFFYMQWSVTLVEDDDGNIAWINGVARNITEQKKTELALIESETRYQFLFETMHSGFALLKMICNEEMEPVDYIFVEANSAHEKLTGLKNSEIIGKRVLDVLPNLEPFWIEKYAYVAKTGKKIDIENWVEGLQRWYQVIAYKPKPGHVAVNFLDITQRKKTELIKAEQDQELRDLNFKFQLAADAAGIGVWSLNLKTNFLTWDDNTYRLYGVDKNNFDNRLGSWLKLVHPDDLGEVDKAVKKTIYDDGRFEIVFRIFLKNKIRYIKATARAQKDDKGRPFEITGVNYDITKTKEAEKALRKSSEELEIRVKERTRELSEAIEKLAKEIKEKKNAQWQLSLASEIFKHSVEGIIITDEAGVILDVNNAFTTITGYSRQEALGLKPSLLKSDKHDSDYYDEMWQSLIKNDFWEGDIWNRRKSGEIYPERLSISSVRNETDDVSNYVAVFHDISDAKASEEKIRFQAHHDILTRLPNRALLQDRIEKAIESAKRRDYIIAILFIDLDNFKNINDSLGHLTGDLLLQSVAERLLLLFRKEDTVARLGGDEFIIMIENLTEFQRIANFAQKIIDDFANPFVIGDHELFITPSIGISCYPFNGENAESLIKNSDTAMYSAKSNGKNNFTLFTREMNMQVTKRLSLENKLRKAIEQKEFEVYFQPKVEIASNQIYGFEALVRWKQEDGSIISPMDFIPLAEETGLIIPMGELIVEQACEFTRRINEGGFPELTTSINLSPNQFYQEKLAEKVFSIIRKTLVNPCNIELEITESTVMTDVERTTRILEELKKFGIGLSIDDFGTGYSSLSYLKHFPIDVLKIDKSFISHLPGDQSDEKITRTIQNLANNFGLKTVAEGVETAEQLEFLRTIGCYAFQGYYCSPPKPMKDILVLLETYNKKGLN